MIGFKILHSAASEPLNCSISVAVFTNDCANMKFIGGSKDEPRSSTKNFKASLSSRVIEGVLKSVPGKFIFDPLHIRKFPDGFIVTEFPGVASGTIAARYLPSPNITHFPKELNLVSWGTLTATAILSSSQEAVGFRVITISLLGL